MKNKQGIQLAFNLRHQKGQQFMTFARIFIANGIDKIHTLSNESALPCGKVVLREVVDTILTERGFEIPQSTHSKKRHNIRGDSAYAREDIMSWCESQTGIDYVLGLAENSRLLQATKSS